MTSRQRMFLYFLRERITHLTEEMSLRIHYKEVKNHVINIIFIIIHTACFHFSFGTILIDKFSLWRLHTFNNLFLHTERFELNSVLFCQSCIE